MRMCIIGLDALECDLVEKFGLNNLKQKELYDKDYERIGCKPCTKLGPLKLQKGSKVIEKRKR